MQRALTPTLALVIAGGLAAGIALARPPAPEVVEVEAPSTTVTGRGFLSGAATDPSLQAAAEGAIEIAGFAFSAAPAVAPGAAITVTNNDGAAHTVTAETGSFDTGTVAGGSATSLSAPARPGTYQFFCTIHPSMRGELVVQG